MSPWSSRSARAAMPCELSPNSPVRSFAVTEWHRQLCILLRREVLAATLVGKVCRSKGEGLSFQFHLCPVLFSRARSEVEQRVTVVVPH